MKYFSKKSISKLLLCGALTMSGTAFGDWGIDNDPGADKRLHDDGDSPETRLHDYQWRCETACSQQYSAQGHGRYNTELIQCEETCKAVRRDAEYCMNDCYDKVAKPFLAKCNIMNTWWKDRSNVEKKENQCVKKKIENNPAKRVELKKCRNECATEAKKMEKGYCPCGKPPNNDGPPSGDYFH